MRPAKLVLPGLLLGVLSSCYSPSLVDGFDCNPDKTKPACPSGFTCGTDNKCARGNPLIVDSGTPMSDGSMAVDAGSIRHDPVEVGTGRAVVFVRNKTGATVAWEDATSASNVAIRAIDLDSGGKNGTGKQLAPADKPRQGLVGDGDQVPYFAWVEPSATGTDQTLIVYDNGFARPVQAGNLLTSTKRRAYDIAATGDTAFVIYVQDQGGAQTLWATRVKNGLGTPNMIYAPAAAAGQTFGLDDVAARASDDGASIFIAFHQQQVGLVGVSVSETMWGMRIDTGSLHGTWSGPRDLRDTSYTQLATPRAHLRKPSVSTNKTGAQVGYVFEDQAQGVFAVVNGSNGTLIGSPVVSTDVSSPVAAVGPVGASASSNALGFVAGIHSANANGRGALFQKQIFPATTLSPPDRTSAAITPLNLVDEADNFYVVTQVGNDLGGDLFAFSTNAGWPASGIQANPVVGAVKPAFAAVRHPGIGGGIYLAWVANSGVGTGGQGSIFVQGLNPDGSSLLKP